ncbi:YheC/YheD family protein [Paenibacillus koleovorans]|uniref:YheC/YheD family protein n=1 Tax=Paenibacillus koleovorans TaxID=121608 RepID=UPI000FD9F4AF|nr:YheC/YheD family protein [Paenibacillus koleovorans]
MLIGLYCRKLSFELEQPLPVAVQALVKELRRQSCSFVLFDADGLRAEQGWVNGCTEQEDRWLVQVRVPFPDAVIPVGEPDDTSQDAIPAEELRLREQVPFTTHPLRIEQDMLRKLNRRQRRREREWVEQQGDGEGREGKGSSGASESIHNVYLHRGTDGGWTVVDMRTAEGSCLDRRADWEQWDRLEALAMELAEEINQEHPYLIDELGLDIQGWKLLDASGSIPCSADERAMYKVAFARYLAEVNLERTGIARKEQKLVALLSTGDSKEALLRDACAYVAAGYGSRFCHLHPQDLTVPTPILKGLQLREGKWESRYFAPPDVVYDRLKARGSPDYASAYARLREIPSMEDRLGGSFSKTRLYELLSQEEGLSWHVLPYATMADPELALQTIEAYGSSVIKPDNGSFGDRLLFVDAEPDGQYVLQDHHHLHRLSREQLKQLLSGLRASGRPYLVQRFVDSSIPSGMVFFIRVHLVRDRSGRWQLISPVVYLSTQRHHRNPNHRTHFWVYSLWETFVRHHFEDDQQELNEALRSVSMRLTRYLEEVLSDRFSEVGIDLGLDADRNWWIFEANLNKIGVRFRELEIARLIIPAALARVQPFRQITEKQYGEGEVEHED